VTVTIKITYMTSLVQIKFGKWLVPFSSETFHLSLCHVEEQ